MKTLLTLGLCILLMNGVAQEFSVFYLAVGSSHYQQNLDSLSEDCESFTDMPAANKSASLMAQLFEERSGGQGILLNSRRNHLLTKGEILENLNTIVNEAKTTNRKQPLLVFYFCGHGVSEGAGWNQYLVPGNFTEKPSNIVRRSRAVNLRAMQDKLIHLAEISDILKESGMPYMLLIDACHEGPVENFSSLDMVLRDTSVTNARELEIMLSLQKDYGSNNPVVFATPPGTLTRVVQNPKTSERSLVGPLCRKMLLIENELDSRQDLSLGNITEMLEDPGLDPQTSEVISDYSFREESMLTFLREVD
ncbi:MAG: caspase family protein [Owenweeksia sp.]